MFFLRIWGGGGGSQGGSKRGATKCPQIHAYQIPNIELLVEDKLKENLHIL